MQIILNKSLRLPSSNIDRRKGFLKRKKKKKPEVHGPPFPAPWAAGIYWPGQLRSFKTPCMGDTAGLGEKFEPGQ